MERTQIYLREVQSRKLKKLAFEENNSMSEQIRKAIDAYLERKTHEKTSK